MMKDAAAGREIPGGDRDLGKKILLLKAGLYGFVGGLLFLIVAGMWTGTAAVWGALLGDGWLPPRIDQIMSNIIPPAFAVPFVCFGIIIASLFMKPREIDPGPLMKRALVGLVVIFAAGILLAVAPLLASLAAVMAILYAKTGRIILLAVAYFFVSALVFFAGVACALVRGVVSRSGPIAGPPWMGRLARFARGDAAADDGAPRRALTRLERWLGALLGAGMFALFEMSDIVDSLRGLTGSRAARGVLDRLASTDALLAAFSMVVFVFSSLFIVRAVKSFFIGVPDSGRPGGPQ